MIYRQSDQFERGLAMLVYRLAKGQSFDISTVTVDEKRFLWDMEQFEESEKRKRELEAIRKATMESLTDEQKKALGIDKQ